MKKFMVAGAALFAFALTMISSATAQPVRKDCQCVNGLKCTILYDSLDNPIDSICEPDITCQATFEVNPPIPPSPAPVASFVTPVAIVSTINSDVLGPIVVTLAPTPLPPGEIRSAGPTRTPLIIDFQFNAIATAEALPGVTLESGQPLHYRTERGLTADPFVNEVLTLQENVDFFNKSTGERVFSLEAGTSFITISGNELGDGGD